MSFFSDSSAFHSIQQKQTCRSTIIPEASANRGVNNSLSFHEGRNYCVGDSSKQANICDTLFGLQKQFIEGSKVAAGGESKGAVIASLSSLQKKDGDQGILMPSARKSKTEVRLRSENELDNSINKLTDSQQNPVEDRIKKARADVAENIHTAEQEEKPKPFEVAHRYGTEANEVQPTLSEAAKVISQDITSESNQTDEKIVQMEKETQPMNSLQPAAVIDNKKLSKTIVSAHGSIVLEKLIGKGNFALVISGLFNPTGSSDQIPVAIKINRVELEDEIKLLRDSIVEESHILGEIARAASDQDSNIAERFFSSDLDERRHYMVMPRYICDLSLYIKTRRASCIEVVNIQRFAKQIFKALNVLKSMTPCIIHCDIKPQNIMVEAIEPLKIRLSDFGSHEEGESKNEICDYIVTRWYRPPEIVLECPYNTSLDMWSVGCTLFEFMTGHPLFCASSSRNLFWRHAGFLGPMSKEYYLSLPEGTRKKFSTEFQNDKYYVKFNRADLNEIGSSRNIFDSILRTRGEDGQPLSVNIESRDFLMQIFKWSGNERATPSAALTHPFMSLSN